MTRIKLPIQRPWIPYIIFVITLILTTVSTYYVSYATYKEDQLRFSNAVQDTQTSIQTRFETYIALLRGGAALFAAVPDPSQQQFEAYVNRLHLQKNYPGTLGIGYAERVTQNDKNNFIATLQSEGFPQFTIKPQGNRSEYYPIHFLAMRIEKNANSLGYDLYSDNILKASMERARDIGQPAASGKILLHNMVNHKRETGFLIFAPVFDGGEIPKTLAERRQKIVGFIYSPFRADELLVGILGKKTLPQLLNYQVYDGTTINKSSLLHDSTESTNQLTSSFLPRFHSTQYVTVGGKTWTIIFTNHPQFENESQKFLAPFIFLGGIIVSIIFFKLSRDQYLAKANAELAAVKLQNSQKELQKAIGIRDNFISIASHELKTPVTSLKVYAEMLYRQFNKKGDKKTTDYLGKIIKQIDKLTLLIQDLLDVSKIQSNQLTFRVENFDLNAMAKEVVETTQQITDRQRILLHGKASQKVWGDRDRISQVLVNLLTNALKYSPKADKVVVNIKDNKIGAIISVKDFGIGISNAHQKKIFSKFYRINDVKERTYPGLGIGLFISQAIIKRHGGEITLHSQKGKGSTFRFNLPYDKQYISIDG